MEKLHYQDHPSRFLRLIGRIFGFMITGVFILFMVPEFINILENQDNNTELWIFIFYALSLAYGFGFLISFLKIKIGAQIMVISSIAIALYGFLDSMRWEVFLLLVPLSFSGILFLIYSRIKEKHLH